MYVLRIGLGVITAIHMALFWWFEHQNDLPQICHFVCSEYLFFLRVVQIIVNTASAVTFMHGLSIYSYLETLVAWEIDEKTTTKKSIYFHLAKKTENFSC